MKLPQEIIDIIFLYLPYNTLKRTREIQTDWVKNYTFHESIYKCVKFKNKKNLIWLIKNNYPLDSVLFERVIGTYNLEFLKFLKLNGCPWDENSIISSLIHCKMDIFNWLVNSGCPFSYKSINHAKNLGNKNAEEILRNEYIIRNLKQC